MKREDEERKRHISNQGHNPEHLPVSPDEREKKYK